jgi:NitT/TauT family transport system permease protein
MRWLLYLAGPLVLGLLWSWSSRRFGAEILYPGPLRAFDALVELWREGRLLQDIMSSLSRILTGFALGWLAGFSLGLVSGHFAIVRMLLQPYIQFFRFISPIAWLSLVLLWFGSGELGKILLIVYTTAFIVCVTTIEGIYAIPRDAVRAALCFGASTRQLFWHVTVPSALSFAITGGRLAIANSFATVVAAEMLSAESGLGYLSWVSRQSLSVDVIFASLACLGVLGLAADRAIVGLQTIVFARFTHGRR